MKNNKGQSLIAFVIFLPVFFMIMALIVDVGLMYTEKRKIDNTIKYAIRDNINNQRTIEETRKIIKLNCPDITSLNINSKSNTITISYTNFKKSIFSIIFKKSKYEISSNIIGIKKEEKIIIERVD